MPWIAAFFVVAGVVVMAIGAVSIPSEYASEGWAFLGAGFLIALCGIAIDRLLTKRGAD